MFKIIILGLTMLSIGLSAIPARAAIFDNIVAAVTGHVDDLKTRYADDEILEDYEVINEYMFRNDDIGSDFAHNVEGTAYVVKKDDKMYIQLGPDFKSTVAPDLYVYVSDSVQIVDAKSFNASEQVLIAKLIKSKGATYYELPEDLDINSITIWCESFGVFMGSSDITKEK